MSQRGAPSGVTAGIREQFLADGFIKLDGIIEEAELLWLRTIYDEFFDPDREFAGARRRDLGGVDDEGRPTIPQIVMPSAEMPELRTFGYAQRIDAIAKYIIGPDSGFKNDHMIMKPVGRSGPTPWHQDQAYHDSSLIYTNINFWLPLEDATVENGCMHYVPGSHRGVVVPHEHADPDDLESALAALDQEYWEANGVAVPCSAGSVVLHHSYMMHSATPNRSDAPRRAYIAVHVVPPVSRSVPWHFTWAEPEYAGLSKSQDDKL